MKLPMPLRRKDPVETLIVLLGAVLVVVFAFFMARGDLDRYAELLVTKEIPPLVEVVEKEELVPVSPLEQWAQEFPQSSPIGIAEEVPSPIPPAREESGKSGGVQERPQPPREIRKETPPPVEGQAFLQAGAFSQEKNARAMVETLRRFGYTATIERVSGMYRVRVYGFSSLEEAKKAAARLRSQGIECFAGR
ncbi:SPOR domain-containing protein [Candidatus Caldatribacterium sp. SIUC1]|uniref:SPOR domain-containing protein n=1 Tax=Candidatus Caldatribacterium sp. SIUC1 TaxID=3418365 RepID=UPI003F68E287